LEKIVEIKRDSSLKGFLEIGVMHRKEPILVRFRNAQEENEFRKNLSYLVYEAQHHPKEVVQYSVVTRFDLGKDGTLSVSCPYCGASAPLRSKESEVTCKYCGKQYIIPKKILDLIG
jgi:DNA-directed RNA polymerase subunit RPC12/RpoP